MDDSELERIVAGEEKVPKWWDKNRTPPAQRNHPYSYPPSGEGAPKPKAS